MRKLECPLSHNKQHHQQKQQAGRETAEWEKERDRRAGCARQQATGNGNMWQNNNLWCCRWQANVVCSCCWWRWWFQGCIIGKQATECSSESDSLRSYWFLSRMNGPTRTELARAGPGLACQHLVHPLSPSPAPSAKLFSCTAFCILLAWWIRLRIRRFVWA